MSHNVQYGMVIDTTRCMGCQTCVVSCKVSNHTPAGLYWGRVRSLDGDVTYQPTGTFPDVRLAIRPELCNHCAEPACVANCPTGAMTKRDEDGVVFVDETVCIGCGSCVRSCPYEIPQIDEETQTSSKCTLCAGRVSAGEVPWCVLTCPGRARIFGDLNDPASEASRYAASKGAVAYQDEYGTGPSVRYVL